ncbi:MAG: hypothetical protein P9L92_08665 [Candidatus Electryonea clarkiae]|nr:hypothetical protein [Candidatus Electryonea clarkiae]MDP8288256.1 hypothetical protein [Candidatus Electryonea clarkiae]
MVRKKLLLSVLLFALFCSFAFCQASGENEKDLKHYVGSSLFLLGNFIPEDPVYAYQITYGHRLTQKDALIIDAKA